MCVCCFSHFCINLELAYLDSAILNKRVYKYARCAVHSCVYIFIFFLCFSLLFSVHNGPLARGQFVIRTRPIIFIFEKKIRVGFFTVPARVTMEKNLYVCIFFREPYELNDFFDALRFISFERSDLEEGSMTVFDEGLKLC